MESPSDDSAAKRNPFTDLIETDKVYVDQLTLVIRVSCAMGSWHCARVLTF